MSSKEMLDNSNEPESPSSESAPRSSHCYVADLVWICEDSLGELPRPLSEQEYKDLFASSRVIDGVRMFPAVAIDGVLHLIRSDAERVQHQWYRSMSGDTLLCKCGAWS